MLPQDVDYNLFDFEIKTQPSKTFQIVNDKIVGTCDKLEALKQSIDLILSIERYKYPIYSWNYGIELNDLYGEHVSYVIPELERRIREALLQDDRITAVDNFKFETNKNIISTQFIVHSIYGDIIGEKEILNV
ncbi:DUF2634 domain-containing protein [Romboutsia lituseburensis]|uniref:DUF2634 domain-containing protein n=1 Tax=Romboutsia lituseburensis TaxID=1537 RepID=UPI0022EADA0C|nr:DUF2634 domain-containing protein [Romboutsia lituseburensis]